MADKKKGENVTNTFSPGVTPTEDELKSPPLYVYTIYRKPRDYPEGYVVRRWRILPAKVLDAGVHAKVGTLEEARRSLPPGLTNLGRDMKTGETRGGQPIIQVDDPCIVETWI